MVLVLVGTLYTMFVTHFLYSYSLVRVVKEAVSSSAAAMREGSNPLDYI